MSVVGIFSSTINNTNTKTCCYMKCKCQIKHTNIKHKCTLNTNSKFTQGCVPNTHAHLYKSSCPHTKHDGVRTKQGSGIRACAIHMVHNPSACCGLVSIEQLHPTLPTLSLPVYLPLLCCAMSEQTTLSTCCKIGCRGNVSVEMCAVILTACSVVHIVHSTHNSREGE